MLCVWTPCRTNTTPRTWLAPRSRLTFPPFCLKLLDVTQYTKRVFLLLFQLATRSYKSDNTNCVALFLTFAGKRVRSGSTPQMPTVSSSGRQLRSLIESYGYASLRYAAAAGGMRSFMQPPPSPSLSLSLSSLSLSFSVPPSLARRLCGESKRFRSNSAHL